jgi:hypothetical protein
VQFDGNASKTCTTPHSVLTPYLSGSLGSEKGGSACNPELAAGVHWIRVRAVDETVGDGKGKIYSLWSDEARTVDSAVPEPVVFTLGPNLSGPDSLEPAVLTSPRNGTVFLDVPTFEWEPVSWATEYELVLARDQDFTNVLGTVPHEEHPTGAPATAAGEHRHPFLLLVRGPLRGVRGFDPVPQREPGGQPRGQVPLLQEAVGPGEAVLDRAPRHPLGRVHLGAVLADDGPFAHKTGTAGASMGGIKWYEFQIKTAMKLPAGGHEKLPAGGHGICPTRRRCLAVLAG